MEDDFEFGIRPCPAGLASSSGRGAEPGTQLDPSRRRGRPAAGAADPAKQHLRFLTSSDLYAVALVKPSLADFVRLAFRLRALDDDWESDYDFEAT